MKFLTSKILEFLPDWNKRIHTEANAYKFCQENRIITLDSENIDDLGEYRLKDEKPVIIIQRFISSRYRNFVLHHEIGHFILHPASAARFSDEVVKNKIEKEANFAAAVAMLPKHIVEMKTLTDIAYEFNIPRKVILFRKWIYDNYRI